MATMKRVQSSLNVNESSVVSTSNDSGRSVPTTIPGERKKIIKAPEVSQNSMKTVSSGASENSTTIQNLSSKSIKVPDPLSAASSELKFGDEENQPEYEGEEEQDERNNWRNVLISESEITWSEPEILSYCSGTDGDSDDVVSSAMVLKFRGESADHIYFNDDAKETWNQTHGYTLVETSEKDGFGERVIRKFYPRVQQKIKTYKKMIPMKITYNKLSPDETGVVEEEDVVNEEMDVDEITDTILVKKKGEEGQDIVQQIEVVKTNVHDPSKKKKYLKLKMINDKEQVVDELIELTDDPKRTSDIMKAAAPYIRRKLKEKSADNALNQEDEDEPDISITKVSSLSYADWVKNQNSQKTRTLNRAIQNLKKAIDNQKMLKRMNKYLGEKLCKHYDLKGKKDPDFRYNGKEENSEEGKANYQSTLLEFNDVIDFIFTENKVREKWITLSGENLRKDADQLTELRQKFYDLEEAMVKDVNPAACESQTYRSMTHQELINQQKLMDTNLSKVRFEHIKSQLILKELEDKEAAFQQSINDLEQVDFINYEAMKAKTKDLNDKLDLKEKQVMAMKDTMTQRVQALAHVRLKIQHLSIENNRLKEEKQVIVQELKSLRMQNIEVQQERRQLEKRLNKILEKEGLEKYPYLLKEAPIVASKGEEQRQLLSELVSRCSEMQSIVQKKLDEHREGVENYQDIKERRRQERKLFSFDIK